MADTPLGGVADKIVEKLQLQDGRMHKSHSPCTCCFHKRITTSHVLRIDPSFAYFLINNNDTSMGEDSSRPESDGEPDIQLVSPDLKIIQDVEKDLEDYSKLGKLGRFGEAARFFKETLHRHERCFAVLAEHCHVLIDQGDFENAKLVLNDSIKRQEVSAPGCPQFESSEMDLLHLLRIYVERYDDEFVFGKEAENILCRARSYVASITASSPADLSDVQVCRPSVLR